MLLVVALMIMVFAGKLSSEWTRFEQWPSVPGTILSARIVESSRTSGGKSWKRTRQVWVPEIRYRYVVSGREYTGERSSHPEEARYNSRSDAQAFLDRNPVGAVRPVHYDPQKPGASFLEFKDSSAPWIMVSLGAAFALAGAVLVLRGLRYF